MHPFPLSLKRFSVLVLLLIPGWSIITAQSKLPTPSQFLGFELGADRQLADYKQIVSYFNELARGSKKIEVEVLGPTTLGNDLVMAVISSEENLKNKSNIRTSVTMTTVIGICLPKRRQKR